MFTSEDLIIDPYDDLWVLGWGVLRLAPWHLDSVFSSRIEAELKAHQLGKEYECHFGTYQKGGVCFIWRELSHLPGYEPIRAQMMSAGVTSEGDF